MNPTTIHCTCKKCGAEWPTEITADQQQAMQHFGLTKLRPNICAECEQRLYSFKLSEQDHAVINTAVELPQTAFDAWVQRQRALIDTYMTPPPPWSEADISAVAKARRLTIRLEKAKAARGNGAGKSDAKQSPWQQRKGARPSPRVICDPIP
jgi:hypothetical protein